MLYKSHTADYSRVSLALLLYPQCCRTSRWAGSSERLTSDLKLIGPRHFRIIGNMQIRNNPIF